MVCPKNRVPELSDRIDRLPVGKPTGVYFLIGSSPTPQIYIGASTDLVTRLKKHFSDDEKDFWNDVVFFTSKDENLTRAHAEYLEAKSIGEAEEVGRCSLTNTQRPTCPALAPAQRAPMDQFFENMTIVLGALGYRFLQPLTDGRRDAATAERPEADAEEQGILGRTFTFSVAGVEATGQITDEGFVVLEGSQARLEETTSIPDTYRRLRDELLDATKLHEENGSLLFADDVLFNSSSAAACLVAGGSRSGPRSWVDQRSRRTLREIESALTGDGVAE